MTNSESLPAGPPQANPSPLALKGWARYLVPSFADCLFIAVLAWLFATGSGGWSGLLLDGDSGWHIRTGEWILEQHRVPQVDIYSFSKGGQPWFAWEWLTDVVYALLHKTYGLKGIVLLAALVISCFGLALFRHMIWKGASPAAVLVTTLLVIGASSIHYHARPHVVTLLFLTISLWMIDADRKSPSWRIWLLVPLTILWVNLHGGFLGLIACLGLLVAGTAIELALEKWLDGTEPDWNRLRRYALVSLLCGVSSIVNPYGIKLHQHIYHYLRSDWIKNNIQEFLSPVFRQESILQYEGMLFLGLMTALWLISKRQIVPALWILFWGHSSLASVRHVPLFMIVASPWVAMGLSALWERFVEPAPKKSVVGIFASLARDCAPACRRTSVWVGVVAAAFVLVEEPIVKWPKDYPSIKFPIDMIQRHSDRLVASRVLTTDQWGDYLIYRNYPKQKVFVDGRSDFFGKEIGDQYLHMLQGHWDWEALLDKHGFEVVLSPVEWPLASLLKRHKDWELVDDDKKALLFVRRRREPVGATASVPAGRLDTSPERPRRPI